MKSTIPAFIFATLTIGCSVAPIKLHLEPFPISKNSMDGELSKVVVTLPKDFNENPLVTSAVVSEWKEELSSALESSKLLTGKGTKRIIVNVNIEKLESHNIHNSFEVIAVYSVVDKESGAELFNIKIESTDTDHTFEGNNRYILVYTKSVSINIDKFIASLIHKLNS